MFIPHTKSQIVRLLVYERVEHRCSRSLLTKSQNLKLEVFSEDIPHAVEQSGPEV